MQISTVFSLIDTPLATIVLPMTPAEKQIYPPGITA